MNNIITLNQEEIAAICGGKGSKMNGINWKMVALTAGIVTISALFSNSILNVLAKALINNLYVGHATPRLVPGCVNMPLTTN